MKIILGSFFLCLGAAVMAQPNVLVIIADDLGWGDIGYNNPGKVYTPNLDQLAEGGVRFNNHYVMPQCTPSRVACFTGRYPSRFGTAPQQASNSTAFPVGTPTLATMLKNAGYRTFLCGKWHMGCDPKDGPNHHGFDYSYGSFAGAVGMYDHRYREGNPYEETWHRNHEIIPGYENGRHVTDLVTDDAVRIIREQEGAAQPFFLMLTYHAPHTPLDERGAFVDQPTKLDPNNPGRWQNEDAIRWFHDPEGIIQKELDPEKRLFLAVLYHLDHAIGHVVEALDQGGLRKNTLILFSSDNGPQVSWVGNAYPDDLKLTDFNQAIPMRGSKCDTYEGGIRVPGFANWPGTLTPAIREDRVHIIDWFPTLAAITGQDVSKIPLDGIDLSPLLFKGEQMDPTRELYWLWGGKSNRWAFRKGDWKLVFYGVGGPKKATDWALFNLREDPKEATDISQNHPEVVQDLHQRFLKQRAGDHQKNQ